MPRLLRVALAAGLATLATVAASAQAQTTPLTLTPCATPVGMRCGSLVVPLNHAAPAQGALTLPVRVVPATEPSVGTIILLAGGPGEAAITPRAQYERLVARLAPRANVVIFDQRGTGATALRCQAFSANGTARSLADAAAQCAAELGPNRALYDTAASATDIEQLRTALGVESVTLMGVSYGTLVAQQYARLFPTRVAGLVLDSPLGPRGNQMMEPDSYAGARRALGELCAKGACAGLTTSARRDVARLSARMARRGIPGTRVDSRGQGYRAVFGGPRRPGLLFDAFGIGDLSSSARAAFPAAVRLALEGDSSMLWRLSGAGGSGGAEVPGRFSSALLASTLCAESVLPWTADMPGPARIAARDAAFAAAPASTFAPFARPGRNDTLASLCVLWPNAGTSPLSTQPLPDVPALVLSGTQDMRTPTESARAVLAELPRGQLVTARGTGHSVASRDTPCIDEALTRFLAGTPAARTCAARVPAPKSVPVPPVRLALLSPQAGLAGGPGRTLAAVRLTLRDAGFWLATGHATPGGVRFGGLRGGTALVSVRSGNVRLLLRDYEFVRGVKLSGVAEVSLSGNRRIHDLVVSGPAASAGRVTIRGRFATGVLGGRPFRVLLPPPGK